MSQNILKMEQKSGTLSMINQMRIIKVGNEIIYNKEVSKSNLCDYNDAYILVRGGITVTAAPATQVSCNNLHHLLNISQKLMEQQ